MRRSRAARTPGRRAPRTLPAAGADRRRRRARAGAGAAARRSRRGRAKCSRRRERHARRPRPQRLSAHQAVGPGRPRRASMRAASAASGTLWSIGPVSGVAAAVRRRHAPRQRRRSAGPLRRRDLPPTRRACARAVREVEEALVALQSTARRADADARIAAEGFERFVPRRRVALQAAAWRACSNSRTRAAPPCGAERADRPAARARRRLDLAVPRARRRLERRGDRHRQRELSPETDSPVSCVPDNHR